MKSIAKINQFFPFYFYNNFKKIILSKKIFLFIPGTSQTEDEEGK